MRAIFGVLGLVLVLGIVGWLTKTQLASNRQAMPLVAVPGVAPASAPAATAHERSQKMQQASQSIGRSRPAAGPHYA